MSLMSDESQFAASLAFLGLARIACAGGEAEESLLHILRQKLPFLERRSYLRRGVLVRGLE